MRRLLWLGGAAPGVLALECPPLDDGTADMLGPVRHARGLTWRIHAPAGGRALLVGTMHLADPRVQPLVTTVLPEIRRTRELVVEVDLDDQALVALEAAMFHPRPRRIAETAAPELYARAARLLAPAGLAVEQVARMKPWALFTTLGQPLAADGPAMDLVFAAAARDVGGRVHGLETVAEQVAVFESLSAPLQLALLTDAVCHHATFQRELDGLIARYAAGDLAGLARLALRHATRHGDAFLDALLWQRNQRMLERLPALLDDGDRVIAVGALHLPGSRGLLEGLEARGYRVEAWP